MAIDERDYIWKRNPYNLDSAEKEKKLSSMRQRFANNYESGIVMKQPVPIESGSGYIAAWKLIVGALVCFGVVVWVVTTSELEPKKVPPPKARKVPAPVVSVQPEFGLPAEISKSEIERAPRVLNVGNDCIHPASALKELECKNREDMARAGASVQNQYSK